MENTHEKNAVIKGLLCMLTFVNKVSHSVCQNLQYHRLNFSYFISPTLPLYMIC